MQVNLKDLVPEMATFKLKATKDYVHMLRPYTNRDEAWLMTNIPGGWETLAKPEHIRDLVRLCYRLLLDKSMFTPVEGEDYDEYGDKIKTKIGGVDRLLESIVGFEESYNVTVALNKTRGVSSPSIEDLQGSLEGATTEKK